MTIPEGAFCPIASPKGKELGVDSEDPKTRSFTSFRMTNLLSSRGGASPEGRIDLKVLKTEPRFFGLRPQNDTSSPKGKDLQLRQHQSARDP
jgi:hypothetical protein